MTERIYHLDSRQVHFRAKVVSRAKLEGDREEVVLDKTAFHPASGGEPGDRGTIEGRTIAKVYERDEEVVHEIIGNLPEAEWVEGQVNWEDRRDIMEQHTGQHILSQAAERVLGVPTIGFRIGEEDSTIELALAMVSEEDIARVEELANRVVREDLPVRMSFYPQDKLAGLRLRRSPEARFGIVRVVEVGDFDAIPCGGVHCRTSGEVGAIAISAWERRGEGTRVHFLCGGRAIAGHRAKAKLLRGLVKALHSREEELPEAVARLQVERQEMELATKCLGETLLDYEAKELYAQAGTLGKIRLVKAELPGRGAQELRHLAERLRRFPVCVALLGTETEDKAALAFSAGEGSELDMREVLKGVLPLVEGRGGGERTLAQGGGAKASGLAAALALAERVIREQTAGKD